jgi:hypothetical protein
MVVLAPKTGQATALSALSAWRQSQRTTRSEAEMLAAGGEAPRHGILIGVWDEGDVPEELWSRYLGEGWTIGGDTRIAPPRGR